MSNLEVRRTIKTLAAKGLSKRAIGRQLGLTEGAVRYRLRRMAESAVDGRARQRRAANAVVEAIACWMASHEAAQLNLAELHAWLVAEHDYRGSLRSVQRYADARRRTSARKPGPSLVPTRGPRSLAADSPVGTCRF